MLSNILPLGDGLWVLRRPPIQLDARWKTWVGTIKSKKIERCNLFLVAVQASDAPANLDGENVRLHHRVHLLLYGLLLQGIPDHIDGWVFTGAKSSTDAQVRSLGELALFYHSHPTDRVLIREEACHIAKHFADGYGAIEVSRDYERMKRGMQAVLRGMKEPSVEERLHEYARALEALIKPAIGATTTQFVHRCQTFAVASPEAYQIFVECYSIRNAVEHMHSWDVASLEPRKLIERQWGYADCGRSSGSPSLPI